MQGFLIVLLGAFAAGSLAAQPTPTLDSYRQARAVLDSAALALGGRARLDGIKTVTVERQGWWFLRNQSRGTEPPRDSIPQGDGWALDVAKGHAWYETRSGALGIGAFNNRGVLKGETRFTIDLDRKTVQTGNSGGLASPLQLHYYFPPLIVRRALERAATARSLGTVVLEGRPQQVVSVNWQDGVELTLYFDAATKLLRRTDRLFVDYELGDAAQEYWFDDYRPVDGIQVPKISRVGVGGVRTLGFTTTAVRFDQPIDSAAFAVPAGHQPVPAAGDPALVAVGPGLWYYTNPQAGYNVGVVEFADHLMILEAPVGVGYSAGLTARLKARFPAKPIRYVVLTHQHWDHISGVPGYVGQGAAVVTTALAKGTVDRVLAARPTLAPDPMRGRTTPASVTTIASGAKQRFADSTMAVEILNVGATPHVNELLAVYVPSLKALFAGDWLRVHRDGPVDHGSPVTVDFVKRLAKIGLDVETVLDVHGRLTTKAEWAGASR